MKENDYAKYYRFDHAAAGEEFAPATSTTTPARAIAEEIWNLDLPRSGKAAIEAILVRYLSSEPIGINQQARAAAEELDRLALLYESSGVPMTDEQLAPVIAALSPYVHGPAVSKCVETVKRLRDENQRNYEYWKSIASNPETDFGVLKWAAWAGEDERVITALSALWAVVSNSD